MARCPGHFPTAVIENLQPLIDGGRYPIKRVVGEDLVVEADIFKDGHDVVAAALKWRVLGEAALARNGDEAARERSLARRLHRLRKRHL